MTRRDSPTFPRTCRACGRVDQIPRALAADCPRCQAEPGSPCWDLRSTVTPRKTRIQPHPERESIVRPQETP